MSALATGRITASDIEPGSVIVVEITSTGTLVPTRRKRGSVTVKVAGKDFVKVDGGSQRRYVILTTDGRQVEPAPGAQTFTVGDPADVVDQAPAGTVDQVDDEDETPRVRTMEEVIHCAEQAAHVVGTPGCPPYVLDCNGYPDGAEIETRQVEKWDTTGSADIARALAASLSENGARTVTDVRTGYTDRYGRGPRYVRPVSVWSFNVDGHTVMVTGYESRTFSGTRSYGCVTVDGAPIGDLSADGTEGELATAVEISYSPETVGRMIAWRVRRHFETLAEISSRDEVSAWLAGGLAPARTGAIVAPASDGTAVVVAEVSHVDISDQAPAVSKGDRVSFTVGGVERTGTVVRVKRDGLVTVDADDAWWDVRPSLLTPAGPAPAAGSVDGAARLLVASLGDGSGQPAGELAPVVQLPTAADADQVDPSVVRDLVARSTWSIERVGSYVSESLIIMQLPADRIDRAVYLAVRDTLRTVGGGAWNKKARGFSFPKGDIGNPWAAATPSGRDLVSAWLAGDQVDAAAPASAPAAPVATVPAPAVVPAVPAVQLPTVPNPDGVPAGLPYVTNMPADWPTAPVKLEPTEVGAMLRGPRGFLAAWFPGVKFSIRSTWSDGITIRWEDGPADNVVSLVTNMWRSMGFDGMTDSTTYRGPVLSVDAAGNATALDLPGVYLSTSRRNSESGVLRVKSLIDPGEFFAHGQYRDPFGRPFYGGSRQDCARWLASMGVDEWARTGSRDGEPCEVDRCALKLDHPWAPVHVNDYGRAFFGTPPTGDGGGNGGGEPVDPEPIDEGPATVVDEAPATEPASVPAGESFGTWSALAAHIGGGRPAPVDQVDASAGHGFICKKCAGPSPVGVGYVADGEAAAEASAGVTVCPCGNSRTAWADGPYGQDLAEGASPVRLVTVTVDGAGDWRIHSPGCRDIKRDTDGHGSAWDINTGDVRTVVVDNYGEPDDGADWRELANPRVMPCAGDLPDEADQVDPCADAPAAPGQCDQGPTVQLAGPVAVADLVPGDRVHLVGIDQYGSTTHGAGYVQNPASPVTIKGRTPAGRASKDPKKSRPGLLVSLAENPNGWNGWRMTIVTDPDAVAERVTDEAHQYRPQPSDLPHLVTPACLCGGLKYAGACSAKFARTYWEQHTADEAPAAALADQAPTVAHKTRTVLDANQSERYATKSNGSCGRFVQSDTSTAHCSCGWSYNAGTREEARMAARGHRQEMESADQGDTPAEPATSGSVAAEAPAGRPKNRPSVGEYIHHDEHGTCEVLAVHGRSGEDIGVRTAAGVRVSLTRHPRAPWLVVPAPGGDQVDTDEPAGDVDAGSIYRLPTATYAPELASDADAELTISHDHENGTTLDGGAKGDGTLEIAQRFRFQWRRFAGVHIPHSRDNFADLVSIGKLAAALREAGHTVAVEIDDVWRPAAEREGARAERAEARTERLGERAGRQFAEADTRRLAARRVADGMPFGEPVKIGHHSERAHRAAFDRIERNDRASYAARDYAQHLANRADGAARNEAAKHNPRAITRRVETLKTDRRAWLRRLADTDKGTTGYARTCRLHLERISEDIAYQMAKLGDLAAAGAFVAWSAETLKRDDVVNVGGSWRTVARINRKGVSVRGLYDWHDGDTITPVTWDQIHGRRRDGMQLDTPNGAPWPIADAVRVERWASLVSRYETCTSYDNTAEERAKRAHVAFARRIVLGLRPRASAQEVAAYGEPADVAGQRARALATLAIFERLDAGESTPEVRATVTPIADTVPAWTMPAGEPVDVLPADLVPGDIVAGVVDGFSTMRTLSTSVVGPVQSVPRKEDRRESGDWFHVTINGEACELRSHRWLKVHRRTAQG